MVLITDQAGYHIEVKWKLKKENIREKKGTKTIIASRKQKFNAASSVIQNGHEARVGGCSKVIYRRPGFTENRGANGFDAATSEAEY